MSPVPYACEESRCAGLSTRIFSAIGYQNSF